MGTPVVFPKPNMYHQPWRFDGNTNAEFKATAPVELSNVPNPLHEVAYGNLEPVSAQTALNFGALLEDRATSTLQLGSNGRYWSSQSVADKNHPGLTIGFEWTPPEDKETTQGFIGSMMFSTPTETGQSVLQYGLFSTPEGLVMDRQVLEYETTFSLDDLAHAASANNLSYAYNVPSYVLDASPLSNNEAQAAMAYAAAFTNGMEPGDFGGSAMASMSVSEEGSDSSGDSGSTSD